MKRQVYFYDALVYHVISPLFGLNIFLIKLRFPKNKSLYQVSSTEDEASFIISWSLLISYAYFCLNSDLDSMYSA